MKHYEELTKQGQARRLRRLAENAIAQFGIGDYRLRLIKHLVNTTFVLTCEQGKFLLRVHRVPEHTVERIGSELAWLDALSRGSEIVVQTPLTTPDGRMVVMAEADGVPTALPVTILTWVDGRVLPQDRRSLRHFAHLGQLIGKLHDHASRWTPPEKPDRRTYDADGVLGPQAAYPLDGAKSLLPDDVWKGLNTVSARLRSIESDLGRGPDVFGFIHFDLSFSNVLFTARDARPIDFDECGFGYYLQDLAVALAGPYGGEGFQERYEAVVGGYREVRALPSEHLRYLPMFLALRAATVILWNVNYDGGSLVASQWRARLKPQLDERLFPVRWCI